MRLEDMEDLDGLESDAAVVPHWIDLSFWHRSGQSDMVFHPRGRMENADLLYMRQSMADDIILKDCDPIDSTSLAGLDTAGHDARVFAMFGEERGPEPVQIVVENVPIEDETGRFGYDGSPEKHHDSNAGVAPISIRARDRPFSSLASSLDNTLSRSTPGIGTLNTRFRRNSPGKYGLPGRSLGASGLGDQLHGLNPFHPAKNLLRMTAHIRRWLHIFPKLEQYSEDDPSIKWFSLSTPACLPLTTDFFPTARQLAERYHEYSYILSPFVDESSIFVDYGSKDMRSLDVLLMELVYHRLAQGFQIIVFASAQEAHVQKGPSVPGAASGSFGKSFMAREVERKPFATGDTGMWTHSSLGKHVYLSLGDHVHHLAFDSLAQNIEVKRYVLKGSRASSTASYQFAIWPNEGPHFRSVSVQFEDSRLISYNWNYLDHLIAGYQDEMTDALRFWRTRFLLIPADNPPLQASLMLPTNETLDEEELRLAGFSKFLEVFEKSRWIPPAERRNADPKTGRVSGIQINLTTFTAAGYVIHEWLKGPMEDAGSSRNLRPLHSGGIGQPGGSPEVGTPRDQSLSRQSSLATIAVAMQLPGAVPFRDRRWHFRLYETTFLGSECVDWMVQAFPDIDSREAAVAFGDELLDRGLFVHVNQKHRFLDGYYYYRLKDEFAPAKSLISKGLRWLAGAKSTSSAEVMADKLKPGESIEAKNHELQGNSTTDLGAPRRPVEMSRSLIVDMDPQKRSNRRELAIVHYDTVHNPKACYHFQLHWLSCTARLMEDMLLSWARMADKCGLRMIEAPVEQIQEFSPDNPFRMVSFLQLSVQPPVREEVKARLMLDVDVPLLWFEMEFLRSLGFIIDVEADSRFPAGSTQYSYTRPAHMYTQMVHRTGLAFVGF